MDHKSHDPTGTVKMFVRPWPVWLSGLGSIPKVKGHWFDSRSGHMTGLWASPRLERVWEAPDRCFSSSLSPSLPLALKNNKQNLYLKKKDVCEERLGIMLWHDAHELKTSQTLLLTRVGSSCRCLTHPCAQPFGQGHLQKGPWSARSSGALRNSRLPLHTVAVIHWQGEPGELAQQETGLWGKCHSEGICIWPGGHFKTQFSDTLVGCPWHLEYMD